jgi:hypothetical protein
VKCPHCHKDIKEALVIQEAARILARRQKRALKIDKSHTEKK